MNLGRRLGIDTPANAAIVDTVQAITRRELTPDPAHLARICAAADLRPA